MQLLKCQKLCKIPLDIRNAEFTNSNPLSSGKATSPPLWLAVKDSQGRSESLIDANSDDHQGG